MFTVAPLAQAHPTLAGFSFALHVEALGVGVGVDNGLGVGDGVSDGERVGLGVGEGVGFGVGVGEEIAVSPQPFIEYAFPLEHLHNPSSLKSAPGAHLQGMITDLN